MDLSIQRLSKVFNQRVVFQELTIKVDSGARMAISGPNGSGKSTLLKIISGGMLPTSGSIAYSWQGTSIPDDLVYRYIHFVAPYNTVIEELSLPELFDIHQRIGLLRNFNAYKDWALRLDYIFDPDRQIKTYSSGMKQRIKLGLALLDERPLLLLDEPGSNLDAQGKAWLYALVNELKPSQTLIIASNEEAEINLCTTGIQVGKNNSDQ